MAKKGDMTEITLVPIEDSSSGHSSVDRPSRTDSYPPGSGRANNASRQSNYSSTQAARPAPAFTYGRQSYVDDTPGGSPPGTPMTGGGGALPYGSLYPPRHPYSSSNSGIDTRSSSPFPQAQTPFVS